MIEITVGDVLEDLSFRPFDDPNIEWEAFVEEYTSFGDVSLRFIQVVRREGPDALGETYIAFRPIFLYIPSGKFIVCQEQRMRYQLLTQLNKYQKTNLCKMIKLWML